MSGEVEVRWLQQCHALCTQSFLASEEVETEDQHTFASHCAMGEKRHYQLQPVSVKKYALVGIFFLALLSSVK